MAEFGITVAAEVTARVVGKTFFDPLIQSMHDAIKVNDNRKELQEQLEHRKALLKGVEDAFELRTVPEVIQNRLKSTRAAIGEAEKVIEQSQRRHRCLHCICSVWDCLVRNPIIPKEIKESAKRIDKQFDELARELETLDECRKVALSAKPKNLPQPLPDELFEGSGFKAAETKVQKLLTEDPDVRVISVHGMPGVGKTTLLLTVYNSHKVNKSSFTDVILVIVSQVYKIPNLQDQIAEQIGLELSSIDNSATRKSMLCASLKKKNFLLILDDLWDALNLQEVGVEMKEGSKVVFSTRFSDLTLGKEQKAIKVETLLPEEGRKLFNSLAFQSGVVPGKLMDYPREFADECKGLPLAITVVAKAMRHKTEVDDWKKFLSMMKTADRNFPNTHATVDRELYQILRTSYEYLPRDYPNLQHCFLYCAMFPEDKKIDVDALVRLWIADGLVKSDQGTYSMDMDLGRTCVENLIERSLFQDVSFKRQSKYNVEIPVNVWKGRYIKVHDVIRDMAIHVGKQQNFLCRADQQLEDFPHSRTQECERISLVRNQIEKLPDEFKCPKLVSLFLSENPLSSSVLESFLFNLHSLRVLDLSHTQIESVPSSVAQLQLLEFLTLSSTNIKELPIEICSLSRLQFLDLSYCRVLTSLPPEMSKLTSLKRLHLSMGEEKALTDPKNVMALKGLTNLIELHLVLFSKFDALATITGTWIEMRHLYLRHIEMNNAKYNLPDQMQKMKKLQSLVLDGYIGVKFSNWICHFEQLERLELDGSDNVKELPPFEMLSNLKFLKLRNYSEVRDLRIGNSGNLDGFPRLEMLHLSNLRKLRSMAEEGVLKEGTLLKLHVLKITKCPMLRKLPKGMEKLPMLTALYGHKSWWDNIVSEDNNMKMHLLKLFKEI